MDETERERDRDGAEPSEKEANKRRKKRERKKKPDLAVADEGHAPGRLPRRAASDDHDAVGVDDSRISGVFES